MEGYCFSDLERLLSIIMALLCTPVPFILVYDATGYFFLTLLHMIFFKYTWIYIKKLALAATVVILAFPHFFVIPLSNHDKSLSLFYLMFPTASTQTSPNYFRNVSLVISFQAIFQDLCLFGPLINIKFRIRVHPLWNFNFHLGYGGKKLDLLYVAFNKRRQ